MANDWKDVEARFHRAASGVAASGVAASGVDFAALRLVRSQDERLSVRRGVVQPAVWEEDLGAMITV
ncbi:MAG: hypothetical protein O2807_10415, partial [bacterium]|nr:hypothetical protein [bacterium]